jgi:hypothetical protein
MSKDTLGGRNPDFFAVNMSEFIAAASPEPGE